ncbi:DUF4153 domain-containing protein [Pseudoalteromonas rhizosphaerae]|uniref:DUF4153 domain-containing protein n=1 Tax=Pseudoalteromonas rhizosphaerae TaxID=2518973 RepID=UPI002148AC68|nr:DUF4153 domain-containing protein [Pseudoalteromonas rhizosphaerae]
MDNQLPKPFIFVLSLVQGIILTLLYRSVENQLWPATEPVWLFSLVTFTISFVLLTLLAVEQANIKKLLSYLLPFSLLLSLLGAYIGAQQYPIALVNNDALTAIFIFTALIASFKALMYIQQLIGNEAISYSQLVKLSWRNFILFAECWLFVLIFWGILQLGAALFNALEITFFSELLKKDWFWIPTLTLAFGFATVIFRGVMHIEDNISFLLQTLIKFLLPVLTVISLGFLATLPFTGLDKLWQTGSGSSLVLWLQVLTLFFVNTVYQYAADQRPYKIVIHRLVFFGIALLPIYSVIAAYGIWLRVEQYGITVGRCWAILVCLLLACFSFGYLVGIVKKRDAWQQVQSKVNIVMGVVILIFMLLVNSPVLNFQRLSTESQIARLNEGDVSIEEFDYYYFSSNLGRQGYLAMQKLQAQIQSTHPEQAMIIERMYVNSDNPEFEALAEQTSITEFVTHSTFWPRQQVFSDELIQAVFESLHFNRWTPLKSHSFYFIAIDLNQDEQLDYVFIDESNHSTEANLWLHDGTQWQSKYMTIDNPEQIKLLKTLIDADNIEVAQPKYNDLKIGDVLFKVRSNIDY